MDKLNKYLHSIIAKHNGVVIYSKRSTYYHLCGRIIRVSDHIGKTSDGSISIIYDGACSDNFIVHAHASGMVSIVNYENLKNIIKSFAILPALIGITSQASNINKQVINQNKTKEETKEETKTVEINKNTIFGIEKSKFTGKQITSLNNMMQQFLKVNRENEENGK